MGSFEHPKSQLDVAIIGAGIGGLSLAIGLLNQNVRFTLYEAAGAYSAIGAGVGLGPNALRAMDMIDKRFKSLYDGISTGNLTPNKEHVMMDLLPMDEGFGGDSFVPIPVQSPSYIRTSAHRKDLLDIMTSLIPLDTVKFNKRAKSYQELDGKVAITFEDGETVEVSAVVGCDGAKGATRGAVLGAKYPDQVAATYSGKYVYRSIVSMEDAIKIMGKNAGDGKWFMGNGANFTTFSISKGAQFNIVAFKIDDKPWTHHQWTKMVDRETMLADFGVGVDKRLVKLLDVSKNISSVHMFDNGSGIIRANELPFSGPNHFNGRFITI
jgi:salicylate hydroxylase